MALLALSYPSMTDQHHQWIQEIRRKHDPQVSMVAPHFTLVFPTLRWEAQALGAHLRRHAQGHAPIAFTLRCAIVVKDMLGESTQTFLVPEQGFGEIVKLHDALYVGDLANELRLDIPFIPHITVASALDPAVCKRVADSINAQEFAISGILHTIDLVQHANHTVTTLAQFPLASGGASQ